MKDITNNTKILQTNNINNIDILLNQEDNLKQNIGIIVFSRDMILNDYPSKELFKAIYSNFFPIAIESFHDHVPYDGIKMYGYSEHFRKIEVGVKIPEYDMFIKMDENKTIIFEKMVEKNTK